jgi:hypothetical protein
MPEHVLVQIRLPGAGPTPALATAAHKLGVAAAALDQSYGVVPVDLTAGLYAVRLDKAAATEVQARLRARESDPAQGVFADVRIEPMGPPNS